MMGIVGVSQQNDFLVSVSAGKDNSISVINPLPRSMTPEEALNLAVWLFCVASMARELAGRGFDDTDFIGHVEAIRNA